MGALMLDRDAVVLCRSASGTGWDLGRISRDGSSVVPRTSLRFGVACQQFMDEVFGAGANRDDAIVTADTLAVLEARQFTPHSFATVYCPEGGPPAFNGFWWAVPIGREASATGEFHGSNLRAVVAADIEGGGLPNLWDADPVTCTELHVHHGWKAADFSQFVAEHHRKFLGSNAVSEAEAVRVANEKEASVRQFGLGSPHWRELYGKMSPHEWDTLWQGWQRDAMAALRSGEAA